MLKIFYIFILLLMVSCTDLQDTEVTRARFCDHPVVLDKEGKIIPWYIPREKAYDHFLQIRRDFIKNHVPLSPGPDPRSGYPQYYYYCAFKTDNGILQPDTWMNDVGEKIPNWFENARLYYAYSGDNDVMKLMQDFIDYCLKYGMSDSSFAWPGFPYTTTNAGDTIFRGFTSAGRFALHEIQVDHAGEMGLTFYRMYLFCGDEKYRKAALNVAGVLASHVKDGNAENSVLPYRVTMNDGKVTASYGANWTGCYMLFDQLIKDRTGDVNAFLVARNKIRQFLLDYPMKTGYWTDGHSDTDVRINTYKSSLSASNMMLCLFDYPDLDPDRETHIPELIKWTEDHFVFRTAHGEPSAMWGANIVGEQDSFLYKMDYQTARYAAACARWYGLSGDESFREKAYRSLNWVTYCNDSTGMAFESPVSKGILSWWSDCYGECPRMFYQVFAAMPELAPPGEDHILYSENILKNVIYGPDNIRYTSASGGKEYLRLSFKPSEITINGRPLTKRTNESRNDFFKIKKLKRGDYSVILTHSVKGDIIIK